MRAVASTRYPQYPRPSCHAAVVENGRVLLVRRLAEPFRGWWGLPGGAVELGETVYEALKREVREETGLEVEPGRFLGYRDAINRDERQRVRFHYVIFFYEARPVGGRLAAASDAGEVAWVDGSALTTLPLVPGATSVLARVGLLPEPPGGLDLRF
ncbi:MAG: NUDIX hydrolase [Clostridia bacterium]|nr:NUDIX hydrolase [Clostridia bacterium]